VSTGEHTLQQRQLSLLNHQQIKRLLQRLGDPQEFLSDYGVRSLSRYHAEHPITLNTSAGDFTVQYTPGESNNPASDKQANWRGPIWFPLNYLLIEALRTYQLHYGEALRVEYPVGSGLQRTPGEIADDLTRRLSSLFLRNERGQRPIYGENRTFQFDPHWRDHILLHEYFHGDSGVGLGASHHTGWTALVANLLEQSESQVLAATRARQHR
jgi:glycosyl hydrolase family 63